MDTIKIKTAQLTGAALDWAVAQAMGSQPVMNGATPCCNSSTLPGIWPVPMWSSSWADTGKLIEKYHVHLEAPSRKVGGQWVARTDCLQGIHGYQEGQSAKPMNAVCRAIVASLLGDEVEVPDLLVIPAMEVLS